MQSSASTNSIGKQVAIDGSVASGKTTVGRSAAVRLGFRFFDTGVMYRAIALAVIQRRIAPEDQQTIVEILPTLEIDVDIAPSGGGTKVFIDRADVSDLLHSSEVDSAVPIVSQVPAVRRKLVDDQRHLCASGAVVVVGRDIGTVVLPNADVKIYLDASVQQRSERRFQEIQRAGGSMTLDQVEARLRERDKLDIERVDSPLRPAGDAIIVDTTLKTIDEIVEQIVAKVSGLP